MYKKLIYLVSFVLAMSLVVPNKVEADLVGWWKFDEGSGTTVADSSGEGNDGTLEGNADWDVGYFGNALFLDGSSWVELPPAPWDTIEKNVTVAFWAFGDDAMPTNNFVFAAYSADENPARQASAHIPWGNGNAYWDTGYDGGAYDRIFLALPPEFQKGTWVHWAFTKDADTGDQKIYINGELFHSGTGMTRPMTGVNAFAIGVRATSDRSIGYIGRIDDFRLYNHTLAEEELLAVMEGAGAGYPYALGPNPSDGTLHEDTWINLSWRPGDFAVSHNVYLGDNFIDVNEGAESTFQGNQAEMFIVAGFPGFPYPDGLVPGTTYYWRIDEVNDADPNSPWKGDVWSFSIPAKTAYFPNPADGAESVDPNVELSWTGGFGSKLHTVYFGDNFDDVNNAAGGLPQGSTTYTPGTLKLAETYYWRVDEFDAIETYKGDVWSFTTEGAVGSPDPANGAVDVKQTQILTWSPGVFAASHQVYFGADEDAVKNSDTSSPEYKGTRDLGAESYDPGKLEWDSTYYWRIDEVNNTNPDSPWTGILWSFTTANFLIVDDFESYNDLDPTDPDSNRIFNAWLDGYDDPANGSLVGYDAPPFAEQTIVHGGNQSLPLYYDNSVGYSEATLTLTYPRDWTEKSVSTLTIWFRGNSDNAAETLYVALNGTAIVNHDNPDAAQITTWTQWDIDLQAFADQGVNLANVNTIAIGLGNKKNPVAGGSGTIYIDDIRLYPPPEPTL
jgi:hypothetical protein